jgi:hypothetical protein
MAATEGIPMAVVPTVLVVAADGAVLERLAP